MDAMDAMDATTDRGMVLGFRAESRLETRDRNLGGHPRTEYRVTFGPVPGSRHVRTAWQATEGRAWQAACARLGLRVRKA